ncbi:hypothetical protein KP509_17G051700 [Ceratopteris richardii]|uniref:Kinesin-like protein n=1 Tax=Ceratopteris richardii TaxID=49495 RepID=A0A8T2SXU3_CERRI|nr:hypothetical protein KP509_17G051700 [Ceratopteris richardii]
MTISPIPVLDDAAVRVAVRARPLLEKEIQENCQECVTYSSDRSEVTVGKERRFTFDHVFGPHVGQEEVYMACVKPLVESCIAGYNATVLAYGQTGSGKTHTMGSANSNLLQEHELGILPRVIHHLYKSIEEHKKAEFLVKCSFVEIHNEEIKDLLHPETPSKSIFIREDANGDIVLAGVREEVVTSFEDMMKLLELGSTNRTTGSTLMNQHSSRSHAIFTIIVEQRSIEENTDIDVITAKFHLVDLAGSERAKRTGAVGLRFKESITINSGLLALGNVISALGDERKRGQHVPYRQSKLTRLLQDSLGGNSRTCMIACISLADINQEETLNTLKYANRARNIHNKPIINRDSRVLQMNQLRMQLKSLQEELVNMRLREKEEACALDCYRLKGNPLSTDLVKVGENNCNSSLQDRHHLSQDMQDSQVISKMKEQLGTLERDNLIYQEKLGEISTEMNLLLRMIPSWESAKEIAETPILFLVAMAKRVLAGNKEGEIDVRMGNIETDTTLKTTRQKSGSIYSSSLVNGIQLLNEADKENSFAGTSLTSVNTAKIIRHYLKTIQGLEKKLAIKEQELTEKEQTLKEVTEDLARDERIFSDKMKEIKALKLLTRELTVEKDCLLQKVQMDATIISDLSHNALAKENELSKLRASVDSLQLQPQEKGIVLEKERISDCNKKFFHQMCGLVLPFKEHQGSNYKEKDDELDESQKPPNEVFLPKETRQLRQRTDTKPSTNIEKRFQDLAYNILKGEYPSQKSCNNEHGPSERGSSFRDKAETEVPGENLSIFDDGNEQIFCNDDMKSGWEMVTRGSHEVSHATNLEKLDSFSKPNERSETRYLHPAFGIENSSVAEMDKERNSSRIMETFDPLNPRDMYIEKKLREMAMIWHAEKQVGSLTRRWRKWCRRNVKLGKLARCMQCASRSSWRGTTTR